VKKIIILLMLVGCARHEVKPEPVKPVYVPRAERIKACVNEMLVKDVKPVDAFRICNGIYRGEL